MDLLKIIEDQQVKNEFPEFKPGDTIKIHVRLIEGEKQRIQMFQGVVIRIRRMGCRSTFTVRKISGGVGVERIFPYFSKNINKIEVIRKGRVRRAKLYYIRKKVGKKAKVKEALRR